MVVSQFSLQANLETVSVRISQRQPGTAYLEFVCVPFGLWGYVRSALSVHFFLLRFGSRMMGQKRRALVYGSIVTIVVLHTSQPSTYHRYLPFLVMFFIPSYIKNCQKSTFRHGVWIVINFLVSLCALSLGQARRVPMPNAQCNNIWLGWPPNKAEIFI